MRLERAGEFDAFFFSSFCSCPKASFVLTDPESCMWLPCRRVHPCVAAEVGSEERRSSAELLALHQVRGGPEELPEVSASQ